MKTILIILVFFVVIIGTFLLRKKYLKKNKIREKINLLKDLNKGNKIFLCNEFWSPDGKVMQMFGESINTPLRPGMSIEVQGKKLQIREVYGDIENPEKPNFEAPEGLPDTPIIVGMSDIDWKKLDIKIKEEKIIAFQISD